MAGYPPATPSATDRHLAATPFDLGTFLAGQGPDLARPSLDAYEIATPLGAMVALSDDRGLHLLEFSDRLALPAEMARFSAGHALVPRRPAFAARLGDWLSAYFAGRPESWTPPVVLAGSPFQCMVWRALATIPAGETRSYGELARMLARPEAVRAVAAANGRNRIAILIPCHRIIGGDGKLTGYGGGIGRKRRLLALEAGFGGRKTGESP